MFISYCSVKPEASEHSEARSVVTFVKVPRHLVLSVGIVIGPKGPFNGTVALL